MADDVKINGAKHAWASIEAVDVGYGPMDLIQEISWEEKQDNKLVYGRGIKPQGYAKGNVDYSGQMVISRDEYVDRFLPWALKQGEVKSVVDLEPFSLEIQFKRTPEDSLQTTRLIGVKLGGVQNSASQGATEMNVTVPFIFIDVEEIGVGG